MKAHSTKAYYESCCGRYDFDGMIVEIVVRLMVGTEPSVTTIHGEVAPTDTAMVERKNK